MNTKTFLILKNQIIERVTGVILIPKDQIKDEPKIKLEPNIGSVMDLDADICPYCKNRQHDGAYPTTAGFLCDSCPMSLAGNRCQAYYNSTWGKAREIWRKKAKDSDYKELLKLVERYNTETDERTWFQKLNFQFIKLKYKLFG